MLTRILLIVVLLIPLECFAAPEPQTDPDSPEVQKKAQAALANKKVLEIQIVVLEIVGMDRGISGTSKAVTGALNELGAKVTGQEITIELDADVLFDFNKYDLRPQATATLEKVSVAVQGYPKAPVVIEGHTDSVGTDSYNLKLSEQRADSVKTWLVKNGGVTSTRISTKGLGETKPVAPNTNADGSDNPGGRQENRRVEIKIKTGGSS